MAIFKTKKEKEKERQVAISKKVGEMQRPPQQQDKAGRELLPQSKRTRWGYRGHDPSREPKMGPDDRARGAAIKEVLRVTPSDLKTKVEERRKQKKK